MLVFPPSVTTAFPGENLRTIVSRTLPPVVRGGWHQSAARRASPATPIPKEKVPSLSQLKRKRGQEESPNPLNMLAPEEGLARLSLRPTMAPAFAAGFGAGAPVRRAFPPVRRRPSPVQEPSSIVWPAGKYLSRVRRCSPFVTFTLIPWVDCPRAGVIPRRTTNNRLNRRISRMATARAP